MAVSNEKHVGHSACERLTVHAGDGRRNQSTLTGEWQLEWTLKLE